MSLWRYCPLLAYVYLMLPCNVLGILTEMVTVGKPAGNHLKTQGANKHQTMYSQQTTLITPPTPVQGSAKKNHIPNKYLYLLSTCTEMSGAEVYSHFHRLVPNLGMPHCCTWRIRMSSPGMYCTRSKTTGSSDNTGWYWWVNYGGSVVMCWQWRQPLS